ncbi:GNAT family N-acetyltransferase [Kushneria indalinina]|uniref:Putative acetyltransferase n=1 Tax=Kushneria indalinina DSM 14324 TaxID=1122140 RepID=A0A3D9DZ33_9GAMM|nr:GNAT family N-acetyltransferase [Kushneria indalinina]REC95961.1 putative acetyltransferase [Kushneria indalinina DSM 14324]
MPSLEGRWCIRRAEPRDAEAVAEIFNHDAVYPCTMQLPWTGIERWRAFLERGETGQHIWLCACDPQRPDRALGLIGLHPVSDSPRVAHVRTLGLSIHPEIAGQGAGGQLLRAAIDMADNWLNVTRLSLGVYSHNQRAIALYERHGFVREGLSRGVAFGHGRYLDSLEMARLHPRLVRELEAQGECDATPSNHLSQ